MEMIEKNILTVTILEGMERSKECPLCYLWTECEERYLKHILTNEVVMDPAFREKLVAARGFCNRHAHMLYRAIHEGDVEDGLGYALYMKDIIEKVIEQLYPLCINLSNNYRPSKGKMLFHGRKRNIITLNNVIKRKTRVQRCPICEHLWSINHIYLHTFVQMLDDEDFRIEFSSSKGLCLPHFVSAMQMVCISKLKNPIYVAQALIDAEMKLLQLVEHLLSEFIRKQSWDFRNEPAEQEVNANVLALNLLFGAEGVHLREINV